MSTGNWKNADGLYLEYGTTKATVAAAGEYKTYGDFREINVRLDLTTLGTAAAIIDNNLKFPTGTRIARVDVISDVAATGSGAVLNVGLIQEDRSTAMTGTTPAQAFVAALPLANIDAVGETTSLTVGSTYAGSFLGTSTTEVGYITADYDTAAFTAGAVNIRIFLYGRGTITQ